MSDNGGGFFRGFILGGLVGGLLGVLFTPKSGREMREDLSAEADKLLAQTKVDLENARKAAMQSFEEGRNKIIEKIKPSEAEELIVEEEKPKRTERKSRTKSSKN
jgi:gas vesicle protein